MAHIELFDKSTPKDLEGMQFVTSFINKKCKLNNWRKKVVFITDDGHAVWTDDYRIFMYKLSRECMSGLYTLSARRRWRNGCVVLKLEENENGEYPDVSTVVKADMVRIYKPLTIESDGNWLSPSSGIAFLFNRLFMWHRKTINLSFIPVLPAGEWKVHINSNGRVVKIQQGDMSAFIVSTNL